MNLLFFVEQCPLASMLFSISPSEKKKAIQYLSDNIPAETLEEVAKSIREDGSDWETLHHFDFGMDVRNLLREGDFDWGPVDLDDIWAELIEKTVKKKLGK